MTRDRHSPRCPVRPRAVAVLLLVALAGCMSDSPVEAPRASLAILVQAPLPGADGAKAAPPTLAEMLRNPDRLAATVRIVRLDRDGRETERIGGGILDRITVDLENRQLECQGTIDLEPDHLTGTRNRLELDLTYRGEDLAGAFIGEFRLGSGLVVTVERLHLAGFTPVDADRQVTRDFGLCLSTPAISGDPSCLDGSDLDGTGFVFEPESGATSFSYRRTNVEWPGSAAARTIVVGFRGALEPTPILTGTREIGALIPGRPDPVTVVIPLDVIGAPGGPGGPGAPGEILSGDLSLSFADGLPPRITGRAVFVRVEEMGKDTLSRGAPGNTRRRP
ncbi:MAG: hypothetical protein IPK64_00145 [bacterium]|nr:hypothetical protein [bacterium]